MAQKAGHTLLADCFFDRPDPRSLALKQSGPKLSEEELVFDHLGLYESDPHRNRELLEREAARNLETFQENQKAREYFRANQRLNESASTALNHGNLQEFEQVFASPDVTKEMREEYLARGGAEAIIETFGTSFNSDTQAVREALDYVRNGK